MFINNSNYNWIAEPFASNGIIHFKSDKKNLIEIAQTLIDTLDDIDKISSSLKTQKQFGSACIETSDCIIAWVDHIRAFPLFYTFIDREFWVSQSAETLYKKIQNPQFNENNLIEFKLSGYVTGKETLLEEIKSLQPGEFLLWDKTKKTLKTHKYFSYLPTYDSKISTAQAIQELGKILDDLTKKIIENANNRQIAIPLSGGLDSRIILCKLHEHGYKNITTFTYGPKWNFEALVAKKIAKKLNIPWKFINVPKKIAHDYFNSKERELFWMFSSNFKTIPCSREYAAIRYIHENNLIDKNAIIINGQSGDYITGGHISAAALSKNDYNINDFYKVIIDKHYDLWKHHKTDKNIEIIKTKIDKLVQNVTDKKLTFGTDYINAQNEEIWEYEGRQICYVVNGQRVYDYYGYDWEMPLWDKKFVDFYADLPLTMKKNQALYKDYLQSYNYKKLFPKKDRYIWRWPIPMLWVLPVAQFIGLIKGKDSKRNFYSQMRYFGHYANQYHFFKWKDHASTHKEARSIISLFIPEWLNKIGLRF